MIRKRLGGVLTLAMLALVVWAGAAMGAERMVEDWRSPFGTGRSVAVDPTDSSVWAAMGASVMHVSATGAVLGRWDTFTAAGAVAVNPTDGSCWVADEGTGTVVHLSATGALLWRSVGYNDPYSLAVNPTDGSCWVADDGYWDDTAQTYTGTAVSHLAADGSVLWRGTDFEIPECVSVNPADGSCWVADLGNWSATANDFTGGAVWHLSASGALLWKGGSLQQPLAVSVAADGSCWAGDRGSWNNTQQGYSGGKVVHLSAAGAELWSGGPLTSVSFVAADTANGCWEADYWDGGLAHLGSTGSVSWQNDEAGPAALAVNAVDGSCWVVDYNPGSLAHLSATGTELWRQTGFDWPEAVSVDPNDGSVWLGAFGAVSHLSTSGSPLWTSAPDTFYDPVSVSVNTANGSCWVADDVLPTVALISAEGKIGPQNTSVEAPWFVSANPKDGSVWVADWDRVEHLDATGTQVWQGTNYTEPSGVSVNPSDGSCWVADYGAGDVVHVAANGGELWRGGGFNNVYALSANPTDGSCWVADTDSTDTWAQVEHLSATGSRLWSGGQFFSLDSLSVNPTDGSVWVGDIYQVAHLASDGTELSHADNYLGVYSVSVNPSDGSCWVADAFNGQVVHLRLADVVTPSAAFAAAPTSGEAPLSVQFADLSTDAPTSWQWNFGDGGASSQQYPSHTYAAAGTYTVTLTATNAAGSSTATRTACITVTSPLPGGLAGHVKDAVTGAAISGATVTCAGQNATSGADGAYALSGIAPGSYTVTASAPAYQPTSVTGVTVVSGKVTNLDVPMTQEPGTVAGTVRDSVSSQPLVGATVSGGGASAQSDANGHYALSLAGGGTYTVTASAAGYNSSTQPGVTVTANQTTTLDFSLTPLPGTLQGTVTDAVSGAPVAGVTVSVAGLTATSDAQGQYTVSNLTPGAYTLTATASGYQTATFTAVNVMGGQTATLDISLVPVSVSAVTGEVRDVDTTQPIAGALVTCGTLHAKTDSTGHYTIFVTKADTYSVAAAAGSYWWSAPQSVSVASGASATANFSLKEIGGPTGQFQEITSISLPPSQGAAWMTPGSGGAPYLLLGIDYSWSTRGGLELLKNNGDLTFTDITASLGLPTGSYRALGIAVGDYNNDGRPDIFLATDTGSDRLYRNDGTTFTEVSAGAGVNWSQGAGRTAAWGDYARNNGLDLIVGDAVGAPQLFQSTSNYTFTNVTSTMGLEDAGADGSVVWADVDNDGWPDLIVSWSGGQPPILYHNNQGRGFTEVPNAFSPPPANADGVAVGDYDNDGWLDVAFGDWPATTAGVQLYHNNGDGTFTNVSAAAGIGGEGATTDAVSWADFDNDGFLDLYASVSGQPVRLYHNNGDGTFTNVAAQAGLVCPNDNKAAVWGDLDLDGRLDLFQAAMTRSQLFHNVGPAGNWLRVRTLTSATGDATDPRQPTRDALGARVEVNVDNDASFPPRRTLTRVIDGGHGFFQQDEPIAQFGLPVKGPVAVRVTFPNGHVVTQAGVAVNQQIVVKDAPATQSAAFPDVPTDYWAYSQIMACVAAGIVAGYPDGTYAPGAPVTRDQMAVYISRALAGGDANVPAGPTTASFTDVPTDYWAFKYVEYAKSKGIVSGYTPTEYMPALAVTRDQMAVFVARSIVNPTGDVGLVSYTPPTTPDFPDVPTSSWAYKYIEYIKGQSITGGYPDGLYHPELVVTRDQMAVYIARAFKLS